MKWLLAAMAASLLINAEQVVVAALAKVGDQVVTTRDLQINQFLSEFDNPLTDYREKKDPLKELIWENLILLESKNLLNQEIANEDVTQAVSKFKRKYEGDRLWASLGVSNKELNQNMRRKLAVKRLITLKMPADLIRVSDEAVETYYLQNRMQLGQRPLAEVREKIEKGLKNAKAQERFKDWMGAMTRTHGVVYYSGFKIQ